jgi:uncharacterized protein (DUF433 family)
MRIPERVEIKNDVMGGKPCVAGTRIPVYLILQMMGAGETEAAILDAYPQLVHADVQACLQYAAEIAAEESLIAI